MTKRELTKEEKEIYEKQLKFHKQKIKILSENLKYNRDLLKRQIFLREFDDKWRKFLRRQKNEEDDKTIKLITDSIEDSEGHVHQLSNELMNGVEVKENPAVK